MIVAYVFILIIVIFQNIFHKVM